MGETLAAYASSLVWDAITCKVSGMDETNVVTKIITLQINKWDGYRERII
jgi:hypothetical protein